jgi:stage III sporulation protein AE
MEIIVSAVIPLFILSSVFSVVGNLSETVRLKKMSGFFMKACKWILGTAFFLFIAFLSVQGITAAVHDGVSVRTAKFAISKYVPIIGGYLSDGFNLVMAGSALVKNAVGMTAVIILILTVLPVVSQTAVFNLSLHLTSAVAEPLGEKRISNILSELAKSTGTLIAVVLGAAFLYFIFLILVICTGSPSL